MDQESPNSENSVEETDYRLWKRKKKYSNQSILINAGGVTISHCNIPVWYCTH